MLISARVEPFSQCICLVRMGVINRDIKLENILLVSHEGRPFLKMCDFGYSINQNHSLPVTAVGTPGYTGMLQQCVPVHTCCTLWSC